MLMDSIDLRLFDNNIKQDTFSGLAICMCEDTIQINRTEKVNDLLRGITRYILLAL